MRIDHIIKIPIMVDAMTEITIEIMIAVVAMTGAIETDAIAAVNETEAENAATIIAIDGDMIVTDVDAQMIFLFFAFCLIDLARRIRFKELKN